MQSEDIEAIDVHAHFGPCSGARFQIVNQLMSGDPDIVLQRARAARTRLTMVSPLEALLPRLKGDPVSANVHAVRIVADTHGLRQWVVVDPLKPETFEQAVRCSSCRSASA